MPHSAQRRFVSRYKPIESIGPEQRYDEGVGDGIASASDVLTCSDDPDAHLPFC